MGIGDNISKAAENAMEAEKEKAPGLKPGPATGPVSANPAPSENEQGDQDPSTGLGRE